MKPAYGWIAGLAGLALLVAYSLRTPAPTVPARTPLPLMPAGLPPLMLSPPAPLPPVVEHRLSEADRVFVEGLRSRFAAVIGSGHAQIRLLEQLIAYLRQHYPEDWQTRVPGLLRALFPDRADALYERFQRLLGFTDWLERQRTTLQGLDPEARRQALWAARYAAFGAEAEEIWAAQRRTETVFAALKTLDRDTGLTPTEKMDAYLAAIHDSYGEQAPKFLAQRQTEVLNHFLDLGSVQTALRALPDEARHRELDGLRQQIGMDEPARSRWAALDSARDQQWRNGTGYMQERARLLAEVPAPQQAAALEALRTRSFNAEEAAILRDEEAAGFYRYGQPRRIGRE